MLGRACPQCYDVRGQTYREWFPTIIIHILCWSIIGDGWYWCWLQPPADVARKSLKSHYRALLPVCLSIPSVTRLSPLQWLEVTKTPQLLSCVVWKAHEGSWGVNSLGRRLVKAVKQGQPNQWGLALNTDNWFTFIWPCSSLYFVTSCINLCETPVR